MKVGWNTGGSRKRRQTTTRNSIVIVFGVSLLVAAAATFCLWKLSSKTIENMALQSTAIISYALEEVRTFYTSEVVEKVRKHGIEVTHDFEGKEKAIPLPINFTIEIGRRIGGHGNNVSAKLYSEFPFPWRKDRVLDEFQRDAIRHFAQSNADYFRFEEYQGRMSLRYARADLMRKNCLDCHNTHAQSPRRTGKSATFEVSSKS